MTGEPGDSGTTGNPAEPTAPTHPAGRSGPDAEGWTRLHPLTPLLRGGWIVLAVLGWIISQQWSLLTSFFIPDEYSYEDPTWSYIAEPSRLLMLLGGTVLVALIVAALSYVSWRVHRYRLTDDLFEVREGVITKKHRQARLDRIQSIDINRPLVARIFGAAVVVIDTASTSGNIDLKYVRASEAEPLREAILRRASGAKRRAASIGTSAAPDGVGPVFGAGAVPGTGVPGVPDAPGPFPGAPGSYPGQQVSQPGQPGQRGHSGPHPGAPGDTSLPPSAPGAGMIGGPEREGRLAALIRARVEEFTDVDASVRGIAPQSLVRIPAGRLAAVAAIDLGSILVGFAVVAGLMLVTMFVIPLMIGGDVQAATEIVAVAGIAMGFGLIVPAIIIVLTVVPGRVLPNLNYSIVGTPDGVRMTRGLTTTVSETIPPGRIHAIDVRQPLLWRPFGWWEVRITRAGQKVDSSEGQSGQAQRRSVLLPVGTADDVRRVLDLVAPLQAGPMRARIVADGMLGGPGDGYTSGPSRGAWLHPLSWRRIGYVLAQDTLFIRRGRFSRKLSMAPAERMQSVAAIQGPVARVLRLANVQAQTVSGVVNTLVPIMDERDAVVLFDRLREAAISAAARDSSHRWQEASARSAIASARIRMEDARARGLAPDPRDLAVMAALQQYEAEREAPAADGVTR